MNRRRFLKLTGIASLGVWLASALAFAKGGDGRVAAAGTAKLYRGDRHGQIFVSADGGASWQLHTNFGSQYSIDRLSVDRLGRVTSRITYRGRTFGVRLAADERSWHTV